MRYQTIDMPLEATCTWLLQSPVYKVWRDRRNMEAHHGLLRIKGKPGSGKSTLMKEVFKYTERHKSGASLTAGFFFNARGTELERSPRGLFQSLLHQLLPCLRSQLSEFMTTYRKKDAQGMTVRWRTEELCSFVRSMLTDSQMSPTTIFVDALDECAGEGMRQLLYFFRDLTTSAYAAGVELNVCLSTRHYPTVTIRLCPEIIMEDFNGSDIAQYVQRKSADGRSNDNNPWTQIEGTILERSSGVFLWVVLVVDVLLRDRDDGKSIKYLEKRLREVPPALEDLFIQLLAGISSHEL